MNTKTKKTLLFFTIELKIFKPKISADLIIHHSFSDNLLTFPFTPTDQIPRMKQLSPEATSPCPMCQDGHPTSPSLDQRRDHQGLLARVPSSPAPHTPVGLLLSSFWRCPTVPHGHSIHHLLAFTDFTSMKLPCELLFKSSGTERFIAINRGAQTFPCMFLKSTYLLKRESAAT